MAVDYRTVQLGQRVVLDGATECVILLLVALQTEYAAFAGSRDFAARLGSRS